MYDVDTLIAVRGIIKKEIEVAKENIIYSLDTIETLQYARGKLNALEALLQDLKDPQKKEDI